MKNEKNWKNNGDSKNPIYDFILQKFSEAGTLESENKKIIEQIKNRNSENEPWIEEISKLPDDLTSILINELECGNLITSIGNTNWPHEGSVVITLQNRFRKENKNVTGTKWRALHDPHYYNEEISQSLDNIEFLLIN